MKQQNILLVSPFKGPAGIKDMFVAPTFGLYRMKFYIQDKYPNITADVVDPNLQKLDFKAKKYDYIGFNLTHTTLEHDIGLIYRAKKESSFSILMAGGIEATFIHDWLLKSSPIDIVVLGEGEEILEQIFHTYDPVVGLDSIIQVPGLVIGKNNGGPIKTPNGRYLDYKKFSRISSLIDFSQIPYSLFWKANADQYKKPDPKVINTIRIFTGNYCPHNCTFCSSTNFLDYSNFGEYGKTKKTKVVILNAEDTLNMIVCALNAYPDTKTIIFDDDDFTMSMNRVNQICQMILDFKKKDLLPKNLTFICQARVDDFKSEKAKNIMILMKKAGFRMIMYGVESFSKNVLSEFGKKTNIGLIENVLEVTQSNGISPLLYLILFSPKSTIKDILATIMKAINCLSKGMEVSINFYIMDIPGTYYQNENDLVRKYKKIPISLDGVKVATINKSEWIYPFDKDIRSLAEKTDKEYFEYEDFFKNRFGIQHIPGRVYTFIIFYAVLDILQYKKEKTRLLEIFQAQYA